MLLRRTLKQPLSVVRGGLVAAAALAIVVGAIGVPLPTGRPKDRTVAFPCMDRACGCHDAADCKEHCCCFSSEEKLAWAAEHGVDAKPFVAGEEIIRLSAKAKASRAATNTNRSCCQKQAASCCSPVGGPRHDHHDEPRLAKQAGQPLDSVGLLSISAYRQCSGFGFLWSVLNAALAPPESIGYEFEWLLTGRVVQQNAVAVSLSLAPPTPPPRA